MSGIALRAGKYEASFRPDVAMLCASLRFKDEEYVAWPRPIEDFVVGKATAIPLVYPWANRLGRWSYDANGQHVVLDPASGLPVDGNGLPMHGNLLGVPFEVLRTDDTRIVARLDYGAYPDKLRAFPFPHLLTVDARLHPTRGLNVVTTVEANAGVDVPISFGWHPYVRLPGVERASWELRWPACEHIEVDDHVIPTGVRTAQAAQRDPIGARTFDDHYALGADRTLAIAVGKKTLTFQFDATYPYAQLFVPPESDLVAIEPMTAEIDALGRGTAPVCRAGERFNASFNVAVSGG